MLLVLVVFGDDRFAGMVADGRQMIRTAIALVETGEIGQANDRDFVVPRAAGDSVSRFGMAASFLQLPAAVLAPHAERSGRRGASQPLFLLVPWLCIGLAGWAAGRIVLRLGEGEEEAASRGLVIATVLLATLASPLGSYASMEFSEPVQAAALVLCLLAALRAAQDDLLDLRMAFLAGFAAGVAVLTKSSLIVAAPAALLPLLDWRDRQRAIRGLLSAAGAALLPLAVWLVFEFVRFGEVFGGYPDDRFTNPWFDGAWRLLFGFNRGFLWFWPALLFFAWAGRRAIAEKFKTPVSRAWLGAALVGASLLVVAAGYWGWHGMEGWGPRLVIAAIPLMAPFAALAANRLGTRWLWTLVTFCLVSNLPPLLQHPTPVATYIVNLPWPEIPPESAERYPFYARGTSADGKPTVVPFEVLERQAAANPWRLYLWMWNASKTSDSQLARALADPPWATALPELVPTRPWPGSVARQVAPRPDGAWLGHSLLGGASPKPATAVYLDGLLDQVIRALQLGRVDEAVRLARKRRALSEDPEADAWFLESLRLAGRIDELKGAVDDMTAERRGAPIVHLVLALTDRDLGDNQRARETLAPAGRLFPGTPAERAASQSPSEWPADLDGLLHFERRDAAVLGER